MGLNNLEKQIKNNIEFFDKEPSMDHMDKFFFKIREQEDQQKNKIINWDKSSWWIGVAASISLLITISWFILQQPIQQQQQQQMGLSLELTQIKAYYNNDSDKKLEEITNCSNSSTTNKRLFQTTETQLMKLTYNAEKLESKLLEAWGNKRLELAYIQSLKTKSDLVNKMHQEICNNNILTQ